MTVHLSPKIRLLPLSLLFSPTWGFTANPSLPQDNQAANAASLPTHQIAPVIVSATPLQDRSDTAGLNKPVDVLTGDRLNQARATTLGETVAGLPGIQTSNYGPGVGRPIIRGLDGPRIAITANGQSTQDVSAVSQDHSPTIEPFLADQIEVFKGPATLLYGSSAIGGAVNVVDGRIPEHAIDQVTGRSELRFGAGDLTGQTELLRLDAGNGGGLSMHVDGLNRDLHDYQTPNGRQHNSWIQTKAGAFGTSLAGDWGYTGLSVSRFRDDYANPGEPSSTPGRPGAWLSMQQDVFTLKGRLQASDSTDQQLRYTFSHSQYAHTEFEVGNEPGTTFQRLANAGRIEASQTADSGWETALGLQAEQSHLQAAGEESFIPKTQTTNAGVFAVTRQTWDKWMAEMGARLDHVHYHTATGIQRTLQPKSLSLSGGYQFNANWHMALNLDHAERAPVEEELFANGLHAATLAYEVGNAQMRNEKANQINLDLAYQSRRIEAKASAYTNRYRHFTYLVNTGQRYQPVDDDESVAIMQWTQVPAKLNGYEGQMTWHVSQGPTGSWDLTVLGDTVNGRRNDGAYLPRIPPTRYGARLGWLSTHWRSNLNVTHYARQDRLADNETTTAGYQFVDWQVAYHVDHPSTSWEIFLDGHNLTNQSARVHTSFLKDQVQLPGRRVDIGLRAFF